jgi:hypothetical protein
MAKARFKRSPQKGVLVGVRFQQEDLKPVDEWADAQNVTRPEAVRQLTAKGVKASKKEPK